MSTEDNYGRALAVRWAAVVDAAALAHNATPETQELADMVLLVAWADYDALGQSALRFESDRLLGEALGGEE